MPKTKHDKRIEEIFKYPDLRLQMSKYEDQYFADLTFQKKSILNKISKVHYQEGGKTVAYTHDICGDNPAEFMLCHDWLIVYNDAKYKLNKKFVGLCDSKNKILIIRKDGDKKEEKYIILHEMIHAYEAVLPENFRQFLVLYLYDRLNKTLGHKKLWQYIHTDNNILIRVHSVLFLLKSLELDLRLKYPLGTIYGYGREELLK